jgi:hypothetical protein
MSSMLVHTLIRLRNRACDNPSCGTQGRSPAFHLDASRGKSETTASLAIMFGDAEAYGGCCAFSITLGHLAIGPWSYGRLGSPSRQLYWVTEAIRAMAGEHISFACRLRGITVEGLGSGITEEDMEHIFAPFFTTQFRGMGLGLSICRNTNEAHEGRLAVSPAASGGSAFQIMLPAAEVLS